jgi:lysozyme family protein
MADIVALKQANARRWADAKLLKVSLFATLAGRLADTNAKQRYQTVALKTRVPWFVIAVIHERECSQDWTASLAQGDPWGRTSIHVPAGRGPFKSWEESAIDALTNCAPHAARNRDWSIGGALTLLETYNGLGYANRGVPSPYIWAGTDQYRSGKFIRDGVFDPKIVDQQLGCAGLLISMMALDPTITFEGAAITPATPASTSLKLSASHLLKSGPSISRPAKGSVGAFFASILCAIFSKRK